MYEINLSTLILIGKNDVSTRIVTLDNDFIVNFPCKDIINNSCKFFGSSLNDRVKNTSRLINIKSKCPIIVEDSRRLIFFPLYSVRDRNNIWISFNNIDKYIKYDDKTKIIFKNGTEILLDCSYYIVDNQVVRSMMLDYEILNRRKSLEK